MSWRSGSQSVEQVQAYPVTGVEEAMIRTTITDLQTTIQSCLDKTPWRARIPLEDDKGSSGTLTVYPEIRGVCIHSGVLHSDGFVRLDQFEGWVQRSPKGFQITAVHTPLESKDVVQIVLDWLEAGGPGVVLTPQKQIRERIRRTKEERLLVSLKKQVQSLTLEASLLEVQELVQQRLEALRP